jgi:hypothetical protein
LNNLNKRRAKLGDADVVDNSKQKENELKELGDGLKKADNDIGSLNATLADAIKNNTNP